MKTAGTIFQGDALAGLARLAPCTVQACVTSPPYWRLRNYGVDGQLGLEQTPQEYIAALVDVFEGVRRVLRDDGTLWVVIGDSYASAHGDGGGNPTGKHSYQGDTSRREQRRAPLGMKSKDLIGIPWMLAFAMRDAGWYLRQDIIWHKTQPMPESVKDRCTKAHDYLFLFSKNARYHYDSDAIAEPLRSDPARWGRHTKRDPGAQALRPRPMWRNGNDGSEWGNGETRNKRDVWTVATAPFSGQHFATYPPALIEPCILAGCPEGRIVLDPFMGAGTTGLVAARLRRYFIGCELNPEYVQVAHDRIVSESPLLRRVNIKLAPHGAINDNQGVRT